MADNTRLNQNDTVGSLYADDDISDGGVADGAKTQRTKAGHGPDGEYKDPCLEFPFPTMPDALFLAEIMAGNVPGYEGVVKFGQNLSIAANIPEDVWDGGGIYDWMSAAAQLELVSSSANDNPVGIGAQSVRIFGLDTNFLEIQEDVPTDGVSPVFTVNSYLRVYRMYVLVAGSAGTAAGDITLRDIGGAGFDRAKIILGNDQTQMMLYTVPAGRTLFILGMLGSIYNSISKGYGEMSIRVRSNGGVFREKMNAGMATEGTTTLVVPSFMPMTIPEKSDFLMRANPSVSNTKAIGNFGGFLKDN